MKGPASEVRVGDVDAGNHIVRAVIGCRLSAYPRTADAAVDRAILLSHAVLRAVFLGLYAWDYMPGFIRCRAVF